MKQQKPFRKYRLDEENKRIDSLTIRLNREERLQLEEDKKIIQQSKDSTAIKQLARIGSQVIHDKKTAEILSIVQGNKRRNKRLGIANFQ